MLVLDDLHWADRPTLALLKHVVPRRDGLRLLVIGTYRDTDLSRDHPLTDVLADLRREEGVERLALARARARTTSRSIMEAAAGHELDDVGRALAREITAETDGNPFFVGEMLRHLTESGRARAGRGRPLGARAAARRARASAERARGGRRRVERLGEDCRARARAAPR